jgi:hypothetical protein
MNFASQLKIDCSLMPNGEQTHSKTAKAHPPSTGITPWFGLPFAQLCQATGVMSQRHSISMSPFLTQLVPFRVSH